MFKCKECGFRSEDRNEVAQHIANEHLIDIINKITKNK